MQPKVMQATGHFRNVSLNPREGGVEFGAEEASANIRLTRPSSYDICLVPPFAFPDRIRRKFPICSTAVVSRISRSAGNINSVAAMTEDWVDDMVVSYRLNTTVVLDFLKGTFPQGDDSDFNVRVGTKL